MRTSLNSAQWHWPPKWHIQNYSGEFGHSRMKCKQETQKFWKPRYIKCTGMPLIDVQTCTDTLLCRLHDAWTHQSTLWFPITKYLDSFSEPIVIKLSKYYRCIFKLMLLHKYTFWWRTHQWILVLGCTPIRHLLLERETSSDDGVSVSRLNANNIRWKRFAATV